ncbi:DUF72 domain-containing protein [Polyangium sp. y55x31]|uniref:DUF72 domain-containing protein n=1 Tax=Polyangium sp. y55x31 TaxID=3042688 RepID=UPI002482ADF7|nr:DUF72 domain-containing protein [Polyangium sp. y55x31]MDI1480302.1 DUF72 domain-containing protein [Polyangium sp. y55x31]
MTLFIGTSGWQYAHWRGTFYPQSLPSARWLDHYAERFQVVEVNNTFYRLPEANVFRSWAERTPADFVFAVKMSRFFTHLKRLRDPDEPIARFFDRASALGRKLGPVLVQLPPGMKRNAGRLDAALERFPTSARVAVEFRDESWFVPEIESLLGRHHAALCVWDRGGLRTPLWRTADFGYVRFHEGNAIPAPCYGARAMGVWARRIAEVWREPCDVFAFFNNDANTCAVQDAVLLARAADRLGITRTRVLSGEPRRLVA